MDTMTQRAHQIVAAAILIAAGLVSSPEATGQTSGTIKLGQAILLEPAELVIKTTGGQKGSATFPKGRHVQVVETSGERSKISVANLAEGWVDNSTFELLTPDTEATPTAVSAEDNTAETRGRVARTGTAPRSAAHGAAVKLKKPQVRTEVEVQESEEFKCQASRCREQTVTHNIKVSFSGIPPEDAPLYRANAFVLVEDANHGRSKEKKLSMIALKESKDAKNNFSFHNTKWNCSCCRPLNSRLVGHAVTVKDTEGNLVTTYKTDLSKKEQEFLEEQIGQSL